MAEQPSISEACWSGGAGLYPWWLVLVWGLLILIIGVMFLTTPGITTVLLITFMGAYWLVGGLFSLASLAVDRTDMGWKIFLAIINIIAGAIILVYPYYSSLFILGFLVLLVGFWACFVGCAHLYRGFKGKDAGNAVLGIISLIFGILLLVYPMLTAALLPYIAGGFSIIFGFIAIFAAFMAKKAQGPAPA